MIESALYKAYRQARIKRRPYALYQRRNEIEVCCYVPCDYVKPMAIIVPQGCFGKLLDIKQVNNGICYPTPS